MHKNARLTPKDREVLIRRLAGNRRTRKAAQAMDVLEMTARKWRLRHDRGEGLEVPRNRPRRCLRALPSSVQRRIEALDRRADGSLAGHRPLAQDGPQ